MLDRDIQQVLSPPSSQGDGDGESWLMSYLDVLTLLITLFVLLLSMAGNGQATDESRASEAVSPTAQSSAIALIEEVDPMASGLRPRHDGLQPRFKGLEMEGVSVAEGDRGITLRIDNNLLFASAQANLTSRGRTVLKGLVETLQTFEGRISVEGHTDNVPISTSRFPSNWELSTGRAISVLRYLAEAGLPEAHLRAIGYADTQPLESNETREGRATNRRVELLLTSKPRT